MIDQASTTNGGRLSEFARGSSPRGWGLRSSPALHTLTRINHSDRLASSKVVVTLQNSTICSVGLKERGWGDANDTGCSGFLFDGAGYF
jgi:hypothetical protein